MGFSRLDMVMKLQARGENMVKVGDWGVVGACEGE